jgi:hypothetical protein
VLLGGVDIRPGLVHGAAEKLDHALLYPDAADRQENVRPQSEKGRGPRHTLAVIAG